MPPCPAAAFCPVDDDEPVELTDELELDEVELTELTVEPTDELVVTPMTQPGATSAHFFSRQQVLAHSWLASQALPSSLVGTHA